MPPRFSVEADIRAARTPPGELYTSPEIFARQVERIFARSRQFVPVPELPARPGDARPWTLLPGSVDEPLLLTRDGDGALHCLSNVCTHRGNLLLDGPAEGLGRIRCRYHGRRFALDGAFLSMPEFDGVRGFPSACDRLARLELERWGPLAFVHLGGAPPFDDWFAPVARRVGHLPLAELEHAPEHSRDYEVQANWALYCDNYLEGFHIPYVHGALHDELDYGSYAVELFDGISLQTGIARGEEHTFALPDGHPDAGKRVAAWYFFLFPNLMLNFYPWGLSLNLVEPLAVDRTRVRFLAYVARPELRDAGAGGDLHRVELEDEKVVEDCHRGLRSRLYGRGRYSPRREQAVHHFHRRLVGALFGGSA